MNVKLVPGLLGSWPVFGTGGSGGKPVLVCPRDRPGANNAIKTLIASVVSLMFIVLHGMRVIWDFHNVEIKSCYERRVG